MAKKKQYTAPYTERVNFNYSEQVVASGSDNCHWEIHITHSLFGCTERDLGDGHMTN